MAEKPSVPSVDVKFDVSNPLASAKEIFDALSLHEQNQEMASSLLDAQPVMGGITNTLFKCTVICMFSYLIKHAWHHTTDNPGVKNSSPRVPTAQKLRRF